VNLTPTGFGIIVAVLLIVAVIVAALENLHDRREDVQDEPEQRDVTCAIDGCTRLGATLFYAATGVLFVCRYHAAQVSEWTGPALFDQDEETA
jgi:Na+-transporting methylmalonyl-CoA/oxaloacetate decarboxylase gamma subunit